jgi:hypothetical protein
MEDSDDADSNQINRTGKEGPQKLMRGEAPSYVLVLEDSTKPLLCTVCGEAGDGCREEYLIRDRGRVLITTKVLKIMIE